ncbi:hypothetical protein ASPZODRAFT_143460 [Penicilliopsis zonata CBS 506.65]|uniref:Cysteine proteinase 1, mitochondrial n=1 Tax=Penicilliopsis zonata CBS 506.65 TaxID=1073090 RepID=A0A1L9SEJ1_9EURO|nr:hypothetical protein ASPZODRAFT_143460 [Penicilliopsis zonata CBS 506.65]OJJ45568.1 hypothetical protein ASPZODRAFT_143460 [Penicilliopsis zonata CBS 506.65]
MGGAVSKEEGFISKEKSGYSFTQESHAKRYGRISQDSLAVNELAPPPYEIKERVVTLPLSATKQWESSLLSEPKNRLAISALSANPISSILTNQAAATADTQTFNIKIPFEGGPITNQRSSGRCWLFASTNVFRVAIMKRYNLKDFELSQAYLFYWDKIEKANWFLEQIIDTATTHELDDRLVQTLFSDPISDGGQWDMVSNLVEKYGLVPQVLYPDGYNAKNSSKMDWLITAKLREQALELRKLATTAATAAEETSARRAQLMLSLAKERFMQEIHSIVTIMLGPVPDPQGKFQWDFYDANGKFHQLQLTPKQFAASLSSKQGVQTCGGVNLSAMFSLVNDPRNEYGRLLTVDRLGNMVGGRGITYVNVDMSTIKSAAINMLKAGYPVFFGCDVGKFSDSATGIMDLDLFDLTLGFNISLGMDKAQRLQTGESSMTHAMVLTAVQVENGEPVRWRVQNSWGETAGDKGWFVMSDKWADQFLYQIVVDPRFVAKEVSDILKQDALVLPRWDPMGVLA